ncbi:IS4 family transposase [Vibrio sp. SS-MA-C1-2]|uniref:IS4 family transposase n=1 Tax=Vibrio sp. SS-MA-C1-2 TaxID=2908646 RepID=UPI001F27AF46|nr:IS4 family transposase [Vibrio sp. SS-MA-C1-2]UJF17058.1 IS4 family transposase [Vibrio sp. SS-MA-C1-2]UJF17087.1 IS4 family transposase [Vibrio sp. SS-MA-C1-2]UJF18474.1 IS4 family transposase [Vibrio sp. SS-MA-C1-2]
MSLFNTEQWAANHFANTELGDKRRTDRLKQVASQLASAAGKSLARTCEGDESKLEGAYRLIRNENVSASVIRANGFNCTAQLAADVPEILALEDTTSLSYRHSVAPQLGKLGKETDTSRGWWVHSVMLLDSSTSKTLGLIHQDWWCRPNDPNDADEKESGKWADASHFTRQRLKTHMSRVISVCDREADIMSYLADKQSHAERFVVRAKHSRKLIDESKLFAHMDSQPMTGGYTVAIPQKGMKDARGKTKNRVSRTANLTLKASSVTVKFNGQEHILNAVYAQESGTTQENEKLSWLLLTSEPIDTLEQQLHIIDIYTTRWRIEDFHKAWKTGAGVERLRMTSPDNLERAASILAFVGIRLLQLREIMTLSLYLRKKGKREEAEELEKQSCHHVLEKDEWRILMQHYKPRGHKGKNAPSLKWAYQSIAKLGGFTDTKRTGMASWTTIWEGWDKLQSQVQGYRVAKAIFEAEGSL